VDPVLPALPPVLPLPVSLFEKCFNNMFATYSVNIHTAIFLVDDCFSETLCNFATLYILARQQKYTKGIKCLIFFFSWDVFS
jgi:hypothetical protein